MPSGKKAIYLASKSPRRQKLLQQIAVPFTVLDVPAQDTVHADMVDETVRPGENAKNYVCRMAKEKAEYALAFLLKKNGERHPILTADTTVALEGKILGKPANKAEARAMLEMLSGKTHQVLTSVAIITETAFFQTVQCSDVTFATLSEAEINAYIETDEPYDKAGGYGIQERAGKFITSIHGSYSSIMGLPLYETAVLLKKAGISV